MKIGILTFHFASNYGAVVQAWALQTYLRGHGHDVRIINYDPRIRRFPWWAHALRKGWTSFLIELKFRNFRRRYLEETRPVCCADRMARLDFDAYVVGSDQVWNIDFFKDGAGRFNRAYFLPSVRSGAKRIAYACSIGEGRWGRDRDELTNLLNGFDAISVRENFARAVVGKHTIKNVSVVPDPTLLLKRDDYVRTFGGSCHAHCRPRIFVYGLNAADRCIKILRELLKLHPDAEVRMVKLGKPLPSQETAGIEIVQPSPQEWVAEIAKADSIVTDSFHGVAVSVNMGKSFYTLLKSEEPNCGDRIRTLLAEVGLEDRIVDVSKDGVCLPPEKIGYELVAARLSTYRERGVRFLRDAVGGAR